MPTPTDSTNEYGKAEPTKYERLCSTLWPMIRQVSDEQENNKPHTLSSYIGFALPCFLNFL
jgi:hypothetical protein